MQPLLQELQLPPTEQEIDDERPTALRNASCRLIILELGRGGARACIQNDMINVAKEPVPSAENEVLNSDDRDGEKPDEDWDQDCN